MTNGSVCVVGSLNADRYVGLTRLPLPGETLLGEALGLFPGGKGLNQAVAAARCGAQTHMCGAVGDDAEATFLRDTMEAAGVDASGVVTLKGPSGVAHIFSLEGGENSIVVIPGANAAVTAEVAATHVCESKPTVVLAQLEIDIAVAAAALSAGREVGAVTVLNAAPSHAAALDLLPNVDILIVNDSELADLGGIETFRDRVTVVHTRGSAGLTVYEVGAAPVEIPAFAITAIDTTGAGDAFCGGLVAALAEGSPLVAAARRGAAAGAIVAQHRGAQTAALSREAVNELVGH